MSSRRRSPSLRVAHAAEERVERVPRRRIAREARVEARPRRRPPVPSASQRFAASSQSAAPRVGSPQRAPSSCAAAPALPSRRRPRPPARCPPTRRGRRGCACATAANDVERALDVAHRGGATTRRAPMRVDVRLVAERVAQGAEPRRGAAGRCRAARARGSPGATRRRRRRATGRRTSRRANAIAASRRSTRALRARRRGGRARGASRGASSAVFPLPTVAESHSSAAAGAAAGLEPLARRVHAPVGIAVARRADALRRGERGRRRIASTSIACSRRVGIGGRPRPEQATERRGDREGPAFRLALQGGERLFGARPIADGRARSRNARGRGRARRRRPRARARWPRADLRPSPDRATRGPPDDHLRRARRSARTALGREGELLDGGVSIAAPPAHQARFQREGRRQLGVVGRRRALLDDARRRREVARGALEVGEERRDHEVVRLRGEPLAKNLPRARVVVAGLRRAARRRSRGRAPSPGSDSCAASARSASGADARPSPPGQERLEHPAEPRAAGSAASSASAFLRAVDVVAREAQRGRARTRAAASSAASAPLAMRRRVASSCHAASPRTSARVRAMRATVPWGTPLMSAPARARPSRRGTSPARMAQTNADSKKARARASSFVKRSAKDSSCSA